LSEKKAHNLDEGGPQLEGAFAGKGNLHVEINTRKKKKGRGTRNKITSTWIKKWRHEGFCPEDVKLTIRRKAGSKGQGPL